jgi:hypothetical protein
MKKCKNCGEGIKKVEKLATCDLTGMRHHINIEACACDDISGRMINLGEKPHYELEAKKKLYPPHIQRKIDQLEELEEMSMALGLHDKIASVRHLISKDIEEESKKEARASNKRIESGWFM